MKYSPTWSSIGEMFFWDEVIGEALWRELGGLVAVNSEFFGRKIIDKKVKESKQAWKIASYWAKERSGILGY